MILSILTTHIAQRRLQLQRLAAVLVPQCLQGKVEWLVDTYDADDPARPSIGEARNRLSQRATGDFQCHLDDDDLWAHDAASRILDCIAGPMRLDVVVFDVQMKINGDNAELGLFDLSYEVKTVREGGQMIGDTRIGGTVTHYRFPNHLCPVRTDILRRFNIKFPDADYGEDDVYSRALKPHLKMQGRVTGSPIYYYDFKTGPREYVMRKIIPPVKS